MKDTKHAHKAALLCMILFIIGPAVWFIPPMVARILHPDLHAMFPEAWRTRRRRVLRDRLDGYAHWNDRPADQRHLRVHDGPDGQRPESQRRLLHQELLSGPASQDRERA